VNEETVLQLGVMLYEEVEHHLAQLVLDTHWEVVQEGEQVLKTYKLREVLGCSHNLY
jgi:hypothetical protein